MGVKSRAGSTPVLGISFTTWATSSAGLEHLVYTERVIGSNPMSPILHYILLLIISCTKFICTSSPFNISSIPVFTKYVGLKLSPNL